ncbi:MAG: sigma-E factor regulatory protein RseB domain-containing protein [Acidimicrobiia bacterium]
MTSAGRRVATVAVALSIACTAALSGSTASATADPGSALVSQSRAAASTTRFSGDVVVEWTDATGRHRRTVHVVGKPGSMQVGDQAIVGAGSQRIVRTDGDWSLLWDATAAPAPAPDRKYDLSMRPGPEIAGHATTLLTARTGTSGRVSERLYFDVETSLLLRRELLDGSGRVVRSIGFSRIAGLVRAPHAGKARVPAATGESSAPRAVRHVDGEYDVPSSLGNGYRLIGRYEHPDGTLQVLYSDGLLAMSVFEQQGELDWSALPAGGRTRRVAGRTVRVYESAGAVAVVWPRGGLVFVCVTEAPTRDVAAAVDGMNPDRGGLWSSLVELATGPFSWG